MRVIGRKRAPAVDSTAVMSLLKLEGAGGRFEVFRFERKE
jgi:hypothetical protein